MPTITYPSLETESKTISTVDQYRIALKLHDWTFEYSDDSRMYREGRADRQRLESAQPLFDADFSIWNSFAPAQYRRPRVFVETDDKFQTKAFSAA